MMKVTIYTEGVGNQVFDGLVNEADCLEIEVDNSTFKIEPLAEGIRIQTTDGRPMFIWPEGKDDIGVFTAFET
jgi:hypothetical protein